MKHVLLLFCAFLTFSANPNAQVLDKSGFLPSFVTNPTQESAHLAESLSLSGIETPPVLPVRAMAEWEELQSLVVTWKYYNDPSIRDILVEIIRNAREECNVIIVCSSPATVQAVLTAAGVDISSNVTFVTGNADTIWVRDYGPNPVYANDVDSLYLIDWIYNRPRPNDDAVPSLLGNFMNIPVYSNTAGNYKLVHTGGNYMSDGMGTGFSSKLVLNENDSLSEFNYVYHTEAEIDTIMYKYLGANRYIKMETLPYDDIHHIDMHIKLLDEETLLVGQYPAGVADGPQIEANLQYVLSNFNTPFGTPYRVIRIPMPPEGGQFPNANADYRTYTNAVFINKTVLIPLYEQQFDTTALRIWQDALPGYHIVGIDCNAIIPYLGAIHCITKEIGVSDPLWIVHQPLHKITESLPAGYPILARIKHKSGISGAKVFYTTDLALPYLSLDMTPGANPDEWTVNIPEQSNGTTIYYYIQATANSGKQLARPLPAPDAYWKFDIDLGTRIQEIDGTLLADVFPNPARSITCVPVHANQSTQANIEIQDLYGRKLATLFSGNLPAGDSKYFFQASDFAPGAYLIVLKTNTVNQTRKLIVR